MPRLCREITKGAIYHVYQRGNNREFIFEKDESKKFFINQIIAYNKKFDFEILAFVIMSNHYHIIIKLNDDPLSKIMFNINNVFAHYYNNENERTGHVFESRYQCIKVTSDAYLVWLLRYVHRNPIRARMVNKLEDYKWSSHNIYMTRKNSLVNSEFILDVICESKSKAKQRYLQIVSCNDSYYDDVNNYKRINELLTEGWKSRDLEVDFDISEAKKKRKSLEEIGSRIFRNETIRSFILTGSRRRDLTELKVDFIREALNEKYTLKEVSNYLNNSEPAISQLLSRNQNKGKC